MWPLLPITRSRVRKYYNVLGCGIILLLDDTLKERNQYYVFTNGSFIFWVWNSIPEDISNYSCKTEIIIVPRLYQKIVVPHKFSIEDISVDEFKSRFYISLIPQHWCKPPTDKLPLGRTAYGYCYDRLTAVVCHTYNQAADIAKIRPAGIVITDPSFYGDHAIPHMILENGEQVECRYCEAGHSCDEGAKEARKFHIDGRWIYRRTGPEVRAVINNNYLNDTHGAFADEFDEDDPDYYTEKMIEYYKNTAYVYIDVAVGNNYYILKTMRHSKIVVAIKEFANVDTAEFAGHVAKEGKDHVYLGGVRDWLNDRKRGTRLFDAALADMMGPKKRAALLCDTDITFTA